MQALTANWGGRIMRRTFRQRWWLVLCGGLVGVWAATGRAEPPAKQHLSDSAVAESEPSTAAGATVTMHDLYLAQRVGPTLPRAATSARPAETVMPGNGPGAPATGSLNARASSRAVTPTAPDSQDPRSKWYQSVEYPLQMQALENRLALAQARADSYRRRLDLFAQGSVCAPSSLASFSGGEILPRPDGTAAYINGHLTPSFRACEVLPPQLSYAPETTLSPVKAFSPRSSFSHVLGQMERNLQAANQELETTVREHQRWMAGGPGSVPPEATALAVSATSQNLAQRLQDVESRLTLARFHQESFERRLQQFDGLSQMTYSASYADLREQLLLGGLESQFRVAELEEEQRLLQTYADDWARLQQAGK